MSSSPRRPAAAEEALLRQKAITAELNQIPLRDVMESHFGFQGRKGGRNMVKYEISPGFYLNCSTAENWFASFNGAPIPGLGGPGRNASGGSGAINAVIAVRSILGGGCDFKDARRELQQAFAAHSLDAHYAPAGHIPPVSRSTPPVEESEQPKELPARFNTIDDYRRTTASLDMQPVLKLPDDLDHHVRSYLTEIRKIPESMVGDLMRRNAAFPSVRERRLTSRRTGAPYLLAEPVVVFPLASWRSDLVVGYDYKTLPLDPDYASFAATEGRKKFGGFLLGNWDASTREAILTEGALDAVSKWVLNRPPAGTCIWGMSGARTSESLLLECQRKGIDVRAAFDNDRAGRLAAAATKKMAGELGVPCVCEFVTPSEIDFSLTRDATGTTRFTALADLCAERNIVWRAEPDDPATGYRGTVANDDAVWDLFARYQNDDQLERMTAEMRGEPAPFAGARIHYDVRNKDWNDQLKGEFMPKLAPITDPTIVAESPHAHLAEMEVSP